MSGVTTNEVGKFVLEDLTPDRITELLAEKRMRGGHEQYITKFVATGSMAHIVNHDPLYKGKTPAQLSGAVKQGLTSAINRMRGKNGADSLPQLTLIEKDDDLLIVNLDAHAAKLAEATDSTEES